MRVEGEFTHAQTKYTIPSRRSNFVIGRREPDIRGEVEYVVLSLNELTANQDRVQLTAHKRILAPHVDAACLEVEWDTMKDLHKTHNGQVKKHIEQEGRSDETVGNPAKPRHTAHAGIIVRISQDRWTLVRFHEAALIRSSHERLTHGYDECPLHQYDSAEEHGQTAIEVP